MKFAIHAHACLEAIAAGRSLVCDPWLVGSAYWRSWWNYPPLEPGIANHIAPNYIYLTHLHWDHFHGPTLKKLNKDKTVIIPKVPESRLVKDIRKFGFNCIVELDHGETIKLGDRFYLTSYQFGLPVPTDSVAVIEADSTVILNCNDAKVTGWPLKQILRRHPRIDFALKSHSSANSRLCYEVADCDSSHIDNLEKYSQEFAAFARTVGAKYAIPFASNQCYLHPETFKFNQYVNYAHRVREHFQKNTINSPKCVVMAPGDAWESETGFHLQDSHEWYEQFAEKIDQYYLEKRDVIDKTVKEEANSVMDTKLARRYASWLLGEMPWWVRRFFKHHPITLIGNSNVETSGLYLDIYNQTFQLLGAQEAERQRIQVWVNNRVLNEIFAKRNWNSLGVSKRLKVKLQSQDIKYYKAFNFFNNALELGAIQPKRVFSKRYWFSFIKRWRELYLYLAIAAKTLFGNNLQSEDYLSLQHLPLKKR